MAKKIPLHTLVQKIQTRQISKNETAKFFTIAPNPRKPFDFNIRINTANVDISNTPSAHAIAEPLLRDAGIALQFKRFELAPKPKFNRKLPLIAEGDSWFRLPELPPIVPETLIDLLQGEFPTINLAHWGDTLDDMISQRQFWSFIESGSSDVLLFSGGGNDVLGAGELATFLELFDVDHARPQDAPYYVKEKFYKNLKSVIGKYDALLSAIESRAPHAIVLAHGYDYAIPRINGHWLGGPLTERGIDPIDHAALGRAIIKLMIDAFNVKLQSLETSHPENFRYVNLRKTLLPQDWWDELHPTTRGAKKLERKFAIAIGKLPASAQVIASPYKEHFDRLTA
jgi:hypothetical protein